MIRDTLTVAHQGRREVERMSICEFVDSADVGPFLERVIRKLKALIIPAHLKAEMMMREAEIGACEDLIRRWRKARGLTPTSNAPASYDPETDQPFRTYSHDDTRVVFRVYDGGKKT